MRLLTVLLLSLMLSGCAIVSFEGNITNDVVNGNGKIVDYKFDIGSNYDSLSLTIERIEAKVIISNTDSSSIEFVIDQNLIEHLDIEKKNGNLKIAAKNNSILRGRQDIEIRLGSSNLSLIKSLGKVSIESSDTLNYEELLLELYGETKINFDINCKKIEAHSGGAASITLRGEGESLDIEASGAGSINTKEFKAKNVALDFSGAVTNTVYAEETLDINGSGTGSVEYVGNPSITQNISGLIKITKIN